MRKKPRIKLEPTKAEKRLDIIGWSVVVIIWFFVVISYAILPNTIPIHKNLHYEIDGYGNKFHIIILPIITTVIYAAMTYINKFPHIFNYGTDTITEENAFDKYSGMTLFIRFIKLAIVFIFAIATINFVLDGLSYAN